jgi:hypothetical protein
MTVLPPHIGQLYCPQVWISKLGTGRGTSGVRYFCSKQQAGHREGALGQSWVLACKGTILRHHGHSVPTSSNTDILPPKQRFISRSEGTPEHRMCRIGVMLIHNCKDIIEKLEGIPRSGSNRSRRWLVYLLLGRRQIREHTPGTAPLLWLRTRRASSQKYHSVSRAHRSTTALWPACGQIFCDIFCAHGNLLLAQTTPEKGVATTSCFCHPFIQIHFRLHLNLHDILGFI